MPEHCQLAGHVVRTGKSLHHYFADMETGEKRYKLLAAHLVAKHSLAVPVLSMKVK